MTKIKDSELRTRAGSSPVLRYIESSALAAAVLEAARSAIRGRGLRVFSTLTLTETCRALLRAGSAGRITPQQGRNALRAMRTLAGRCHVIGMTEGMLVRAGRSFPIEPVRTLNALHLAIIESLVDASGRVVVVVQRSQRRPRRQRRGAPVFWMGGEIPTTYSRLKAFSTLAVADTPRQRDWRSVK